jgi:cytochrome c553
VDPSVPGSDVPASGGSLLDAITLDQAGGRNVPFPFERLVQRIEAAAGCTERERCTRAVLIPLGRSLQRAAASPNFFAHPRIVLAVTQQRERGMPLRDRIFLGYQESEGLIEAISYNDAAGRFEFQLIKNYREGATPRVFQARRAVCISCHQNHAPVFSRQVWSETNANARVASRLAESAPAFSGIPVAGSSEISNAVDDSTERANRLSVTNALWRVGCGDGSTTQNSGDRCRVAALRGALQFALASERGYVREAPDLVDPLAHAAKTVWRKGIAIPNPDIPNRDPFAYVQGARGVEVAHIPAALEPLVMRPPLDVVSPQGHAFADELVRGIAATWSSERVALLDSVLSRRNASRRTIGASCHFSAPSQRGTFECRGNELIMSGSLGATALSVDSFQVGNEPLLRYVATHATHRSPQRIIFTMRDRARTARLTSGDAIEQVELKWSGVDGSAAVTLRAELSELFTSVPPSLIDTPLPQLIDVAIAQAGGPDRLGCCATTTPVRSSIEPIAETTLTGLGAALEPHCGACHRTPDASPPNFLAGNQKQVEAQLASCAPRIYVRLAMSALRVGERDKTPMPPETAPRDAREIKALASLQAQLQQLVRKQYGKALSVDELLASGYERLPACLPLSTTMH